VYTGSNRVDLSKAYKMKQKYCKKMKIYPAALEFRNGDCYSMRSRTICVVGVADGIQEAREISLEGIKAIEGGSLWYRRDIASKDHILKSVQNMNQLRD
jgi:phosphoribosylamine-glycine ligase